MIMYTERNFYSSLVPQIRKNYYTAFPRPSLTDIDSLLSDMVEPSNVNMNVNEVPSYSFSESVYVQDSFSNDGEAFYSHDEVTFYDQHAVDKCEKSTVYQTFNSCNALETQIKEEPLDSDSDSNISEKELDKVKHEITEISRHLKIPRNPSFWTPIMVRKWAKWVLEKQYHISPRSLNSFNMSGETLCQLDRKEFESISKEEGQCLYAELECWKQGYYNILPQDNSSMFNSPRSTYIDLQPVKKHEKQENHYSEPNSIPPFSVFGSSLNCSSHDHVDRFNHSHDSYKNSYLNSETYLLPNEDVNMNSYVPHNKNNSTHVYYDQICINPFFEHYNISPCSRLSSPNDKDSDSSSSHSTLEDQTLDLITPSKHNIHLWQFLRELLLHPRSYGNIIKWLDRSKGIFKIEDSVQVAKLWGRRKNRPRMNYDKLSRSIRQYYKKGIIKKTENSKRLIYQFCPQYCV